MNPDKVRFCEIAPLATDKSGRFCEVVPLVNPEKVRFCEIAPLCTDNSGRFCEVVQGTILATEKKDFVRLFKGPFWLQTKYIL